MRALVLMLLFAATIAATKSLPPPPLPKVPTHTEFLAEVNARGQVVRVKSAKLSTSQNLNLMEYGNVLQMWIRHPDGTAIAGLYRVKFDYDPKTEKIHRGDPELVSVGGNWANEAGAATTMTDKMRHEYEAQLQQEAQTRKNLPSLETIVGATPSPTPHP